LAKKRVPEQESEKCNRAEVRRGDSIVLREVGDRPLLDRHPLFGSVLPLRAENVEAREGRSERREGNAISYTLPVSFPHIFLCGARC